MKTDLKANKILEKYMSYDPPLEYGDNTTRRGFSG